jgi:hypothetical protein
VDDAKFEQDFALFSVDTSGQQRKLAKYILARLEADASNRACDPDTDPATIEHILPENPGPGWEAFPEAYWSDAVYRLGNLTLLEASANRRVGNSDYAAKRAEYAQSSYRLTQLVAERAPTEWTLEHLERRQRELAQRAVHIWRVDFV